MMLFLSESILLVVSFMFVNMLFGDVKIKINEYLICI